MAYKMKYFGKTCTECGLTIERGAIVTHNRTKTGSYKHSPSCKSEPEYRVRERAQEEPERTIMETLTPIGDDTPPDTYQVDEDIPFPETDKEPPKVATPADPMAALAAALQPHLKLDVKDAERRLLSTVEAGLNKQRKDLEEQVGRLASKVTVTIRDKSEVKEKVRECVHPQYKTLLQVLSAGHIPLLVGPPGWGKSHHLGLAAEDLGIEYGHVSIVASMSHTVLTGHTTADGSYKASELYKFWTEGGLYALEEVDQASSNTISVMNTALANGSFAFPGVGTVKRHDRTFLAATANTALRGAAPNFPEARKQSAAFRTRFVYVDWQADNVFERNLVLSAYPNAAKWVQYVQAIRAVADKRESGEVMVTPRQALAGASLLDGRMDPEVVADSVLWQGANVAEKASFVSEVGSATQSVS